MNAVTMYRRPLDIESALNDFDQLINAFFGEPVLSAAPAEKLGRFPVDVKETEDAYLLEAELPGFSEQDISLNVDAEALIIEAKSKKEEAASGKWLVRERRVSDLKRSFRLPKDADPENVGAHFKDGLLIVEMKKREEMKRKSISIETK